MKIVFLILAVAFLFSCNSEYHPETKRKGYFRIDFPEKKYQLFDSAGYPYTFEYPVYGYVTKDSTFFDDKAEDWWINIDFPQFNGRAFISYKPVGQNNFEKLVNDAFTLRSKQHINISTGIEDSLIRTPNGVEGVYFSLGGNTATANQFFLTDSVRHFLRGALYFDATPNADSLGIVNDFLKKDLLHLINTLRFKG
jgi:gliding motility-associated lipoprotein GldD